MFRKNSTTKQPDLFRNIASQLSGKSYSLFSDKQAWHNVFRENVYYKIDESIFACLYDEKTGSPNYPLNILISMMILKEGFGWSDSELFEAVRFNVLVRSSLGMTDFEEREPAEASYYNFRKRINEYDLEHSRDLYREIFAKITAEQVIDFKVNGRWIRMDSKLLGSNIARVSRFELVHGVIKKFYQELNPRQKQELTSQLRNDLEAIDKEEGEKMMYRKNSNELNSRLLELGKVMYQLKNIYQGSQVQHYELLTKVFEQQFKFVGEEIQIRGREELKASNIQSPEDKDCDYRKKGDQEIFGGYSANAAETCGTNQLNLITAPEIQPATAPDNEFYQAGIEKTNEVTQQKVEEAYTDGAYHSQENKIYNEKNNIEMVLTGLQGKEGRFELDKSGENLMVTDKETGEVQKAQLSRTGNSYKVDIGGKNHYITKQAIENYEFRVAQQSIPAEKLKRRNNVEATIFQISFFTRNNKLRYRGLQKVKAWMYMRCLWINMVRIKNYMEEVCLDNSKNAINEEINTSANTFIVFLRYIFQKLHFWFRFNPMRFEWINYFPSGLHPLQITNSRGDIKKWAF
jgi:hypothetical protein